MQNTLLEESASTTTGYRLSPQQKQVWQEQQNSATNYCAQAVIEVDGDLDRERLREAATAVVARHEILRTSFPRRPGMRTPMQVIHEEPSLAWDEDNEAGFRLSVVRLSAEEWHVMLSLPSICADEASLGILAREIFREYVFEPGEEPVQYIQFSEWQHELAESEDSEAGRAFWREQQTATFPFAASPQRETRTRTRASLSRDVTIDLERVAAECKTSTETVLLACWLIVLWRLTTQETISVNCVFDGRPYEELQEVVGLFARALPVSCSFDEQQTFAEFVQQLEQRRREVMEWQECFDSELSTAGVGFEYVEQDPEWKFARGLQWRIAEQRSEIHRPRLGLRCANTGDAIELELDSDLENDLLPRVQLLVEAAVRNVNRQIGELPIVDRDEWNYLVRELSHSDDEAGDAEDFIRLFETSAERFPTQSAVVGEDETLTYDELNRRANQLAHYLCRLGVRPEMRVAIGIERSAKLVVAMLGVLKAGGAYVPLDLTYSRKQLSFMLEDSAPLVLLTQENLLPAVPEHAGRNVCLDSEWDTIAHESADNPPRISTGENLAYVIYTSGSTGTPKGVGIEHRQLQNYLRAIRPRLGLNAGASYATVSTFAADLGNTVIFPALATGGCLHVISKARATNADALAEYFSQHEIDCMKIVPSHLEALLETSANVLPRHCLVLGGETLRRSLVAKIEVLAPECRIINHYGPTETTVGVLSYPVNHGGTSATLPLGRPLAGTQVYLLDRHLAPVPFGVAATLYVGGESVSRGYLNRPDLTAERFIPNPFGPAGTRLYNTGDVARYTSEGNVEFLGRNDNQVKIHGYRVELGEIESALLQHESVRDAVVITVGDAAMEKRLAAYIVCRNNHVPAAAELRDFLMKSLAAHLIPADFVLLKSLPLNANGKVDRRALVSAEGVSLEMDRVFVEPRTALEEVLVSIWSDVLKKERVGIEDNFFALGGNSLAAMQVMARIRNFLQMELSLRTVFEATTIATLAQAIVENETEPGLSERKARVWKKLEAMSPAEKEALRQKQRAAQQDSTRLPSFSHKEAQKTAKPV